MRFFFIFLFIWLAVVVARRYFKRAARVRRQQPARIGTMVRCNLCGLHVPETEALKKNDKYYCSVQHRDGLKNHTP